MATESFYHDIVIDSPEVYARYVAILQETSHHPLPEVDFATELKGGEEWLKRAIAERQA